jgi:tetratricopeptide (TPR) repeat protein
LLYEDMKKPKEAATVYETVAEVLPEDRDAWTRFVEACEKAELYDKAITGYEKLLELMPDKRRGYFAEIATLHARLGNETKSIEFTEKLLAVGADDEVTHRLAADLYSWNRMYEKAAEHYLQAIEHAQGLRRESDYRLSLARTYREMEEYQQAKEVYETLLTTPGTDATKQRAREELHYIYEKIGKTSEAIDQADERVRSLRQKRTSLLEGIGELEKSQRDDGDSELEMARLKREFAEVQDELTREYELLATTYERQQDVGRVIDVLESLLEIVPEEQRSKRLYLYQRVAFAYMRAGDGEKAVEYAKKTVQEEPYVSGWHNGLAQAYEHNERYPEAAEEYKKAIELGKNPLIRTQNRLRLAGAYSMMSAHGPAEAEYKRVLEETTETIFLNQARRGLLCLYALQAKLEATLDMLEGQQFELYKVAVEQYINFGKREEAAAILREPISITADDVELCMELAYLLHKSALFQESLALYERVVELAPDSPHAEKAAEEIAALKRNVKRE